MQDLRHLKNLNYTSILSLKETQRAIKFLKDLFEIRLSKELNIIRVSAPLYVTAKSGLNDYLSGKERPVNFHIADLDDDIEIVQSLAKWKRNALKDYHFQSEAGLYADMNAIRKDEVLDAIHSIYVDQWDFEIVINKEDRNIEYLKETVRRIYCCVYDVTKEVELKYPELKHDLPKDIFFITSEELKDLYPNCNAQEREHLIAKEKKAVFIIGIGWPLNGTKEPHGLRASDYDDWNLNGDLLLYYPLLDIALEICSMGIRVDGDALIKQLDYKNEQFKLHNDYCKNVLNKTLPYTLGGGIGQSRLCLFMLNKAHIGEVQASVWSKEMKDELLLENIKLL